MSNDSQPETPARDQWAVTVTHGEAVVLEVAVPRAGGQFPSFTYEKADDRVGALIVDGVRHPIAPIRLGEKLNVKIAPVTHDVVAPPVAGVRTIRHFDRALKLDA